MNAPIRPAAVTEENRSHPGLPTLLTACHLVDQERKGTPANQRAEAPAHQLREKPMDQPPHESPHERPERHPDAGSRQPADRVARLTAAEVRTHAAEGLAALLVDAVDDGASVGFLAPLETTVATSWWSGAAEEAERGVREVWAAHGPDGSLTGVVTLVRAGTANGRHRGEISRLLVHRSARGRGLGRALLAEAEAHAAATGLTLLVLDTQTDSPAERLYRGAGWTAAGTIPDFAADPAGVPRATTLYYKRLG
ncbi:GNAT family N-acetyltransferase [Streptomyces sp. NPDC101490]|uniref:GNAT family N-acetyltransferase n=1 Tax=Streptomyces sp. NPDC101490 TaxID=3366143 RepID=UPI00380D2A39